MRRWALGILVVAAAGCRRSRVEDATPSTPTAAVPLPAGGAASAVPGEGDAVVEGGRSYPTQVRRFSLADHGLRIEDVGMTRALDQVLARRPDADLVVNGGFFGEDGRPVGLALSGGVTLSALKRSLSGGVLTFDGARARLHDAESFVMPDGVVFALQCRPRLVVGGVAHVKSDDGKRSERTALCLRDGGETLDVVVVRGRGGGEDAGPSLYALGAWLAARGCEDALNLDGGPSTGVVAREGDGGTTVLLPRGPVRHAVVVVRR